MQNSRYFPIKPFQNRSICFRQGLFDSIFWNCLMRSSILSFGVAISIRTFDGFSNFNTNFAYTISRSDCHGNKTLRSDAVSRLYARAFRNARLPQKGKVTVSPRCTAKKTCSRRRKMRSDVRSWSWDTCLVILFAPPRSTVSACAVVESRCISN